MKKLVLVAHPDDETLFFSGLILSEPDTEWTVVSVTDGNGDGRGKERYKEFAKACAALGVKNAFFLNYKDAPNQRLPIEKARESLKLLIKDEGPFHSIYTHGVLGEYGHAHHQDVCFLAHQAFKKHPRIFSVAYNTHPEVTIVLGPKDFEVKTHILWDVYGKEIERFLNFLPATATEGFIRLKTPEVESIYNHLAHKKPLKTASIRVHKWLIPFLKKKDMTELGKTFISSYLKQSKTLK